MHGSKENGLLSIWLAGMLFTIRRSESYYSIFNHKKMRIHFITDDYFGKIDSSRRLVIKDSILYFRCDGKSRGKIGLAPGMWQSHLFAVMISKRMCLLF